MDDNTSGIRQLIEERIKGRRSYRKLRSGIRRLLILTAALMVFVFLWEEIGGIFQHQLGYQGVFVVVVGFALMFEGAFVIWGSIKVKKELYSAVDQLNDASSMVDIEDLYGSILNLAVKESFYKFGRN